MSDDIKKTTVYHFQHLQERFRDYTPSEESPDWNDYCTYLAMKQLEEMREKMRRPRPE